MKNFFSFFKKFWLSNKLDALQKPWHQVVFQNPSSLLMGFQENHHYFSSHPLIGKVTQNSLDFEIVQSLLFGLHEEMEEPKQRVFTFSEIFTKVLAYRDLNEGQELWIPYVSKEAKPILEKFVVDRVLNLWNGMPAFGLIAKSGKIPPILLYRGTDFSLMTKRGLSSLLSDLDFAGPGKHTYLHAQDLIRSWLIKVQKATVMGFSLGGALAAYTLLYEHEHIAKDPHFSSIAFASVGVAKKVHSEWSKLSGGQKSPFMVFITKPDLVPKIGQLFGDVYEIQPNPPLSALMAHLSLMSAQPYMNLQSLPQDS
jgi:hypothetical protein